MSSQIVATVLLALIAFGAVGSKASTINPLCEPGTRETMPSNIKQVCDALESSTQLSKVLSAYIRNEAAALLYRPDDLISSNTGKRTDVDHVFLRFGRRR